MSLAAMASAQQQQQPQPQLLLLMQPLEPYELVLVVLMMMVNIISVHRIENFFLASGVPDVDGPVPDADGALRGLICRTISQPQTGRR